jgi:hypothetical protein
VVDVVPGRILVLLVVRLTLLLPVQASEWEGGCGQEKCAVYISVWILGSWNGRRWSDWSCLWRV